MGCAPEPNYHGRQLIRALKSLREQARLTQEEAGEHLNLTLQKLSRLENGQLPGWHELQAVLDLYGLPTADWPFYLDLWEQAKKRGWWRQFGLKDPRYVRMEHEASAKYEFQLGHIPTLLQTERYARDFLTRSGRHVASELPVLMHQQKRLYDDLRLHSLVHEPVLRQCVDRPQLRRISQQSELPNVTFQVVPQGFLHAGLQGSVVLLSFEDPHEPDIAFTHDLLGLSQSQNPKVTSAVRRTLEHLASAALSPADSLALVRRLCAEDLADHPVR